MVRKNIGGCVGVNSGDIVNIQSKVATTGSDYTGGIVGKNSGYITLRIASDNVCNFLTDNFGTVAGYTSESGHITNVCFANDILTKVLQPFGKNSQYIYEEMCENAYYGYFVVLEEYPCLDISRSLNMFMSK